MKKPEILELMRDGWELGIGSHSRTGSGRAWLQRSGLCRGGESKTVRRDSVRGLEAMGLISRKKLPGDPFWLTRFVLRNRGE
jgi:hypothetical protein